MNLAKGTRVRMTKPLQEGDKVGEIYTVERSNESVVVLTRSREYEVDDFMGSGFGVGICGYGVTSQEFSEHFEVIGMEEPKKDKKNVKSEALIGDYTETELDVLWNAANYSYEDFKKMLKLSVKWCDKDQKKQREWAGPYHEVMSGVEYYISKPKNKSWKIKVCNDGYVGIASCRPDDHFVISTGVELAAARAEVKKAKAEVLKEKDLFNQALKTREEAVNRLDAIMGYAYRRVAK